MGEKDKAKLIPISIKKKTSVSKSGKGVVVRQPVSIEDKNQNEPDKDKGTSDKNTEDAEPLHRQEETFDLDRIEKELAELDKQESFLERLSRSFSEERTLKRLKSKKEELELRYQVRTLLADIEKQNVLVRKELLDVKTSLLEKEVMSHKDVQKLILDIKLKELSIEKLHKEIEKLNLEQTKKELERELEDEGKGESTGAYSLKKFKLLGQPPDNEDDDEGSSQ